MSLIEQKEKLKGFSTKYLIMLEKEEARSCDRCGDKFPVLHNYAGFNLCYRCIEIARDIELVEDGTNRASIGYREWEKQLKDIKYLFTGSDINE